MKAYLVNGTIGGAHMTWISEINPFMSLLYFRLLYADDRIYDFNITSYHSITDDEYKSFSSIKNQLNMKLVTKQSFDIIVEYAQEKEANKLKQQNCEHDFKPFTYVTGHKVEKCTKCELDG